MTTTIDFITALFCQVDDHLSGLPKHPEAHLWPSEVVTLGLLHALQGGGNRAFYRWLTRDYRALFPRLPERTRLFRLFTTHQDWTQVFLAAPTVLGVIDTYGIELIHPMREGRSPHQIGRKGLSNHRWMVGGKLCLLLNQWGLIVGWACATANVADNSFQWLIRQFEVAGIPLRGMEGGITQDNHLFFKLPHQPLKGVICDIRGGTRPSHDQPPLIQEETKFPADNPAVIREAFAANLLETAAFAHRMYQFDPIGVDDAEHRRRGQEDLRPVLMGPEKAKEARPLGELRKQRAIVSRQPAIKRPVAHAFERMQQPQGDDLAGPEVGVGMFGDTWQMVIDLTE